MKATEAALVEKGLELEAKNYFSALFPLLDDEKRDASLKNDQNRIIEFNTAVCYLLAFVFPRLDSEFLAETYSADGTMFATLSHSMRRFHLIAPFVRSVCVLVGSVLAAHPSADWKEEKSSLGELFVILLGWTVDSRPKVRRVAQETIGKLLRFDQAMEFTTEFVASALLNATRKEPSVPIQLFPLMKQLLPSLSSASSPLVDGLDNLVTGLLNCLNLGNTHLSVSGYEIIQNYAQEQFELKEEEIDRERLGRVYGIVKRINDGILKHKPTPELVELSVAVLPALAQCTLLTVHLQQILQKDFAVTLQTSLQVILQGFFTKTSDGNVLNAAGSALVTIFLGLFDCRDAGKWSRNQELLHQTALPILREVSNVIVPVQGRQLQDAMTSIRFNAFLPVLSNLIEILGDSIVDSLGPLILQVARLHDCRYLTCREDLVRLVSVLIRVAGLPATLKLLPLNLIKTSDSEEAPRAWLLPVLRDSVYNTSMLAWIEMILPVAEQVSQKAEGLRSAEKAHEARVWDTLHAQLLSILPAVLASFPVDFSEAFPKMSELIARLLNDDAQLRPTLMAALQRFIQNSRSMLDAQMQGSLDEIGLLRVLSSEQIEADLSVLTAAMPQFLPILFNIYAATTTGNNPTVDEDDDSCAASSDLTLKLIETLLGLTEEGVVADYFAKTVMRIERMRESGSLGMLGTVLELSGTMIPHASRDSLISNFIPAVLPLLSASDCDISLQKKAYRGIVRSLTREDVRATVMGSKESCEALYAALTGASESLHSAAKKIRFRLLNLIASELPDDCLLWIPQFLPEVLLGVKEVNHKTRTQAYELIVSWGRRMSLGSEFVGFDGSMRSASLQEFITMVLAGLAGNTPHMISATIMALARIIFEFAATMKVSGDESSIVSSLTADVCMLLQSPSREIVKSAISFVKVALVVLDSETIDPLLPGLVEGLLQWSNVHHQQFKLQVRHLMERLMRRFGYERMEQVTPADHHALLANIKKCREKKGKKQKKDKLSSSEGGDNNEIASSVAALSRASKRSQFLMGDDIEEGSRVGGLSSRARFEQALNDSEDEEASDFDDENSEKDNEAADDKISSALTRKLNLNSKAKSTVTLKSVTSQRLPNISRRQQEQLARQLQQQQQQQQQKKRRASSSSDEEEDEDDNDVRFGSDGKLHIGAGATESHGDMDKIYRAAMTSFKRSADGKHVKFARGTKANRDDDDFEDDHVDARAEDNRSTAAFSGMSRLSKRTDKSFKSTTTGVSHAHSGSQFRAKKGSFGDAKRKGAQFDPYAYVPIQRKSGKHGHGGKENISEKYFMKNNKRARK